MKAARQKYERSITEIGRIGCHHYSSQFSDLESIPAVTTHIKHEKVMKLASYTISYQKEGI
jgi:hypothetical protein